jgi:hypothetical protein
MYVFHDDVSKYPKCEEFINNPWPLGAGLFFSIPVSGSVGVIVRA